MIKKTYDSYVNLQHFLKVVIFSIFVNLQKCCKFTYESYVFFFKFCFLCMFCKRSYMVSLHRRVREEAPSHVLIEDFLRTLFRRCRKAASERDHIWYPYTRGSEKLPKKCKKNAFRRAWIVYSPVTGPQNATLQNFWFFYSPRTGRIESGNKRATLRGRRPRVLYDLCILNKTRFFAKNLIFLICIQNWTPGPNFGARLTRPNWPCPESLLLFYKLFSKSDPAREGDAISA